MDFLEKTEAANLLVDSNMIREIYQQPRVWNETYESLLQQQAEISSFLTRVFSTSGLQTILTGAGSSAFIGDILQASFFTNTHVDTRSVATTDIVTHHTDFFSKSTPVFLVSFARSGDSPESIATFELAQQTIDTVYHLIITCNPEGKLAKAAAGQKNCFVFLLPEATNDLALAMTSSFTSMTLAGLLISDIKNLEQNGKHVALLAEAGQKILDGYAHELQEVARMNFKRVVFLGSGPLKGAARESHLKVIELTDGEIVCQFESYLGFRHGPKAIVDESTLMVYLLSNDSYVSKYERDLVQGINQTDKYLFSIGIGQNDEHAEGLVDLAINAATGCDNLPDEFLAICSIIPAQLLGFYKSFELGLIPDSPSTNGGIHRVVQGVTIYPAQP